MNRLVVLALLISAIIVTAGLSAVGLPIPFAIALAFLIVGIVVTVIERRMDREAPVFGITMFVIAAIAGIAATVHAIPQVNGKIVGFGTFAVELLLLFGVFAAYRRLSTRAGGALRQRLAGKRGWRYEREAPVPVPGPHSAGRMAGVPTNATSTTGRDAVFAVINGQEVIVFDRVRAKERNAKAQTVFLVRLPVALPYVLSSYARYLALQDRASGVATAATETKVTASTLLDPGGTSASGLGAAVDRTLGLPALVPGQPGDHTDDPAFANVLMTPEVRRQITEGDFIRLWWIEGEYLCAVRSGDNLAGAKASLVEEQADRLAGFAAGLPWSTLRTYAVA